MELKGKIANQNKASLCDVFIYYLLVCLHHLLLSEVCVMEAYNLWLIRRPTKETSVSVQSVGLHDN